LAALVAIRHQRITDPKIGELLGVVEGSDLVGDPLSVEAVNIRHWRRHYDRVSRIPERLAVEIARATAEGQSVWEKARPANDWELFRPFLERIVDLKREEAEALGYEKEPYDALLDNYEEGETAGRLEPIFKRLVEALKGLLESIEGSPRRPGSTLSRVRFPVADQETFALHVTTRLGYELEAGRLDVSAHPFTSGIGPGDVRITTRYSEDYLAEGLLAAIHEAGHAMYYQGLPLEHWGELFCRPASLGINESQSRMWENIVARSETFWKHFYVDAKNRFPCLADVPLEDFVFSINEVRPSLIRTEADEVTYNLHVLLRFQLETALMRKDLQVNDLPTAWNEKMQQYLGVMPPDYANGVMQDVHWSSGSIGYFPTYTLGNLYAAQLFSRAEEDLGALDQHFAQGDFTHLLGWLRQKVHSQGARYKPRDLLQKVTGENLDPQYLIRYLQKKYSALYRI
jgi:carboxypeptidase Taq